MLKPRFDIAAKKLHYLLALVALLCSKSFIVALPLSNQVQSDTSTQPPFHIQVKSRLVVVRVVVRDSTGKPIKGLHKEDFGVFDQGKEQAIEQFDAEDTNVSESASTAAALDDKTPVPAGASKPTASASTRRFIALYFDDLNTTDEDLMRARTAAENYLNKNLHPADRFGIFTSDKMLVDFTDDQNRLHDALTNIRASSHSLAQDKSCPSLSDYQAYEITQFQLDTSTDAWRAALEEARQRGCTGHDEGLSQSDDISQSTAGPQSRGSASQSAQTLQQGSNQGGYDPAAGPILALAQQIVEQTALQSRSNLQEMGQVVTYLATLPGQRTLLLVSPGFMSQNTQPELDRLIDRALRKQVVISSIDPRGLAMAMGETDITQRDYTPSGTVSASFHRMETAREFQASDVMAEVAQGTGGEFVHNDNDLKNGFAMLAQSPISYVLAFTPHDLKIDGKFHALKVTLSEGHKDFIVQARRGYFAFSDNSTTDAEAHQGESPSLDAQTQQRIRTVLLSREDLRGLPIQLHTEVSKGTGPGIEFSVLAHLDAKSLHFHREGAHNQNTVTFVCVIFDGAGKSVGGKQQQARIDVPDSALAHLLETGVDVRLTFQLKPGDYTVREVVTDSEDHSITALSRGVNVPQS